MSKQLLVDLLKNPNFEFRSDRQSKMLEEFDDAEMHFGSITVYIRTFEFDSKLIEVRLNWSALDSVDTEAARLFVKDMVKAVDFSTRVEVLFLKDQG